MASRDYFEAPLDGTVADDAEGSYKEETETLKNKQ